MVLDSQICWTIRRYWQSGTTMTDGVGQSDMLNNQEVLTVRHHHNRWCRTVRYAEQSAGTQVSSSMSVLHAFTTTRTFVSLPLLKSDGYKYLLISWYSSAVYFQFDWYWHNCILLRLTRYQLPIFIPHYHNCQIIRFQTTGAILYYWNEFYCTSTLTVSPVKLCIRERKQGGDGSVIAWSEITDVHVCSWQAGRCSWAVHYGT